MLEDSDQRRELNVSFSVLLFGDIAFLPKKRYIAIMIFINIIFVVAFLLFAYVNINDSDWWLWVPIYLYAALFCGAAIFGYYFPLAYLIGIGFYILYALILFFKKDGVWDWITRYSMQNIAETMQATKPWIEQTREFFGLLIATVALVINYYMA